MLAQLGLSQPPSPAALVPQGLPHPSSHLPRLSVDCSETPTPGILGQKVGDTAKAGDQEVSPLLKGL